MKRGKGVGEGTGPEGEKGGKNEGKKVGIKAPETTLESPEIEKKSFSLERMKKKHSASV